jgi:hypothetical protein
MTRLIAAFLLALGTVAAQTQVTIHDDRPFPESLTSTADGSLYFGSTTKGIVYRSAPGAAMAEPWITSGLQNVLGVLADEKSNTMWVCANQTPGGEPTALKAFDLKSGAAKGSYPFTGGTGLCNDIAMGADGSAYATDTRGARILKLKPGAAALEVWAKDDQLAAADGLAFSDASTLVVNTYSSGRLVKIPVSADGSAGAVTLLQLSQPLVRPDGMRVSGPHQFLLTEGAGKLDRITVDGDHAKIEVIKDGYTSPTAVTLVGSNAFVLEGKLAYRNDPKLKDQDPGPIRVVALPVK